MKALHTLGPWEACIQAGCHAVIASVAGEAKIVAVVGNNTPDDGLEPMRFANARAIAAVPDLLAVAKQARESLAIAIQLSAPDHFRNPAAVAEHTVIKSLDAAIAKAEGGAL